jgi:biotin synthase-related radical SAM superfamily protein
MRSVSATSVNPDSRIHPSGWPTVAGRSCFIRVNRGIEITLAELQFPCALDPHLARAPIDSRGLAPDLVGIDEDAAGSQVLEDVGEKMTLAAVG